MHAPADVPDRPLTTDEVAALLGVHRLTVYRAAQRGDLPHFRIARRYLFPREAIGRLLRGEKADSRSVP